MLQYDAVARAALEELTTRHQSEMGGDLELAKVQAVIKFGELLTQGITTPLRNDSEECALSTQFFKQGLRNNGLNLARFCRQIQQRQAKRIAA